MKRTTNRHQQVEGDRRELRVHIKGELMVIARPVPEGFEIIMGPGQPDELHFWGGEKVTLNIGKPDSEPRVLPGGKDDASQD